MMKKTVTRTELGLIVRMCITVFFFCRGPKSFHLFVPFFLCVHLWYILLASVPPLPSLARLREGAGGRGRKNEARGISCLPPLPLPAAPSLLTYTLALLVLSLLSSLSSCPPLPPPSLTLYPSEATESAGEDSYEVSVVGGSAEGQGGGGF